MKTLLLATALLLTPLANADTLFFDVGVNTTHINEKANQNEDNDFVSIEYRFDNDHGINASSFTNSYGGESYTIGGSYSLVEFKYIELGLLYGVVKGYEKDQLDTNFSSDYGVYVAPRLTIKYDISESWIVKASSQLFGNAVETTAGVGYSF
jgi:hypothetical protein